MARPTRRRFLNSSISLAAAMSAGAVLADDVGKGTAVPDPQADGPVGPVGLAKKPAAKADSLAGANDRVNIAVIGCGGRGQYHVSELLSLSDHANIVALCDPDVGRVEGLAQHVEDESGTRPKTCQDLRKLLEDKEIDAVTIATPNHWHSLAGIWAIQAGKDAYVEKPISHNVSEGRRLVEFARRHNKIVLTGTQSRSMPVMNQAMQFLHDGHLGRISLARGLCYKARPSIGRVEGDQPIPQGVDYDLWCGPAPVVPLRRENLHYDWHWFWDTGNGDLGNQGVHQMDICLWGLGKRAPAERVRSIGGRIGYIDDGQTPNTQLSLHDYADGAQIIFEVRGLPTQPLRGTQAGVSNVFYGTEGTLVVNGYDSCSAYAPDGTIIEMPDYDLGATGNHLTTFIKAIRSRALAFEQGEAEAGHVAAAMCHLANISHRLGTKVPFNAGAKAFGDDRAAAASLLRLEGHLGANKLKLHEADYVLGQALQFHPRSERFPGNDAANAMLAGSYREGFTLPKLA